MAEAAKRSSANTDLYIGTMAASIGLFGTNAKPAGLPKDWETAGPNGGHLKFEQRGVARPAEEQGDGGDVPVHSDPLATSEPTAAEAASPIASAGEVAQIAGRATAVAQTIEEWAGTQGRPDVKLPPATSGSLVEGEFRRVLVEEGSGEVVEPKQVRRGVRREDDAFIDCTDQLEAIEERTKLDRMEVVRCIDSTRIRRQRVIGAYFIGGMDAESIAKLRLLYEALRTRREVAVVKYTTRSRQQLGVIEADAKTGTLMLLTIVWSEDWRDAPAKARAIAKVTVPERQVAVMSDLLGALHGTVDVLDELRDDAIALREELLARAKAGELAEVIEPLPVEEPAADLEEVLAASLAAVKSGKV